MDIIEHSFRTLDEATELAATVAATCPDPSVAAIGLAELMVNAVEHGNLGLSYDDKCRLGGQRAWHDEIQRRLADPRFADRVAQVRVERRQAELVILVRDQGAGFDAAPYVDFDRTRLHHHHGRGIAIARHLCFDHLDYRDGGREAVATIRLADQCEVDHATAFAELGASRSSLTSAAS